MGALTGKGGGGDSLDFAQVEQATRQQQRMNNPNVSNAFGSTTTSFGADDQANITQTMSPDMQGLYQQGLSHVQNGANQFTPESNSYNQQMMQNFNQNLGDRSGFQVPQREMPQFEAYKVPNNAPPQGIKPNDMPVGFSPPTPQGGQGGNGGHGGSGFGNEAFGRFDFKNPDTRPGEPPNFNAKAQQFMGALQGQGKEEMNPLARALMQLGGK